MPRGAEYDNNVPQSDNAIEQSTTEVHGVGGTTDDVPISRASKTAPLPEGMDEMNDRNLSMGAAPGHESGKGGNEVRVPEVEKGMGALPGTTEDKTELAKGEADIADRDNPSGIKTGRGSSK